MSDGVYEDPAVVELVRAARVTLTGYELGWTPSPVTVMTLAKAIANVPIAEAHE